MEKAPLDEVYPYCHEGWEERTVLRVISGSFKGRRLTAPKGLTIRPTPDKVKGAIFNILGDRIIESSFLDLFAGTGAVGIEALSRGAKEVVFADNNIRAIDIIKKNLSIFNLKSSIFNIVNVDAVDFIKKTDHQFDFIFIDPPYKTDLGEKVLIEISSFNILKEDGEIIWEHYYKKSLESEVRSLELNSLTLKRTIRYGDTALSFFSYH